MRQTEILDTYTVIEFRYTAIRYWQARQQHQVHQSVDVALFGEVEGQRTFAVVAGCLKITNDLVQQGKGRQNANLFPVRLMRQQNDCVDRFHGVLFIGFDAILLWRHEVE